MLPRKEYLDKLVRKKDNGRVKVITGLRRSGKSVLVFQLFRDYLLSEGVSKDQIIGLALDVYSNAKYRNPMELDKFVRDHMIEEGERYYILIDEIQCVSEIQNPYVDDPNAKITFIDVVLGFMQMKNADVYVTGSAPRQARYTIHAARTADNMISRRFCRKSLRFIKVPFIFFTPLH